MVLPSEAVQLGGKYSGILVMNDATESGERPRQPEGHAPAHTADSSTLLPRLFCLNPTLQHCRLPNVTKRRSKRIFTRTSYPRGHSCGIEDVEGGHKSSHQF